MKIRAQLFSQSRVIMAVSAVTLVLAVVPMDGVTADIGDNATPTAALSQMNDATTEFYGCLTSAGKGDGSSTVAPAGLTPENLTQSQKDKMRQCVDDYVAGSGNPQWPVACCGAGCPPPPGGGVTDAACPLCILSHGCFSASDRAGDCKRVSSATCEAY